MTPNFSSTAAFLWSVADLLRGDFKQSQYGRIILPFTLLRRLECVLEQDKAAVLQKYAEVSKMNLPEEAAEKMVLRVTQAQFFNASPMDLSKLGEADIKDNLESYIQAFSQDAREIFEYFKFSEFIGQLSDANLLYKVVQKFANTDLSPQVISNYEMGLVFEELIRRFAESSNETAGEHFTPRDIVRLTTSLVLMEDDAAQPKKEIDYEETDQHTDHATLNKINHIEKEFGALKEDLQTKTEATKARYEKIKSNLQQLIHIY